MIFISEVLDVSRERTWWCFEFFFSGCSSFDLPNIANDWSLSRFKPLNSSQNRHEMWNTKLMLPRKSSARNPTLISFVSKCLKPIFAEHSTIYRLYNQCLFPVLQAEIRFVSMTKKPGFFRRSKKLQWRNVMELPVVRLLPWFMPPTPTSHWEWQMRRA